MNYFPIFLDVSEKNCLVIGAGVVGKRKIATLVSCSPKGLTILDTSPPDSEIQALLGNNPAWRYEQRSFLPQDLEQISLVLICTNDARYNQMISSLCKEKNILCNSATASPEADTLLPATLSRNDLTLAISTGGKSPALARHLRLRLERMIGEEYGPALQLLGKIREDVLALQLSERHNKAIFSALAQDELLAIISARDTNRLAGLLQSVLPDALHDKIRTVYVSLF